MDRSDVIKLIKQTYTMDSIGQQIPTETERTVFCNARSITRNEWVAGGQMGLNPQLQISMFAPDYEDEKIVEYKGVRFSVYRTYKASNEILELYLENQVGIK